MEHTPAENSLHQISISHDPVQDRLLLRVSNTGGQEFHYWLTRRFTLLLGQALQRISDWFGKQQVGADTTLLNARQELVATHAVDNAQVAVPYEAGKQLVSGNTPLLLVTINIAPQPPKHHLLQLVPVDGGVSVDLRLDENLVHVMTNLLKQGAVAAEWAMSTAAAPEAIEGNVTPTYRLH